MTNCFVMVMTDKIAGLNTELMRIHETTYQSLHIIHLGCGSFFACLMVTVQYFFFGTDGILIKEVLVNMISGYISRLSVSVALHACLICTVH